MTASYEFPPPAKSPSFKHRTSQCTATKRLELQLHGKQQVVLNVL